MTFAVEAVGTLAAAFTTIAYLPQSLRTIRTRSTGDFSLKMLGLLSAGLLLWVAYGIYITSWPIILSNVFTFGLVTPILYFKLRAVGEHRSTQPEVK